MSLENICRAVKATLDGAGYPVSVGMRNAGTATPCIVYEINSATCDMRMSGPAGLQHWTVELEIACVADTVEAVAQMVDSVRAEWQSGPVNNTTYDCSLVMGSFAVAFTAETPDDGQQDAERIGTISMTLLVQED
jgi:hypothetical protein